MNTNQFNIEDFRVPKLILPSVDSNRVSVRIPKTPFRIRLYEDVTPSRTESVFAVDINDVWYLVQTDAYMERFHGERCYRADLFEGITEDGETFILIVTEDESFPSWTRTALEAVARAQNSWITMESDTILKQFKITPQPHIAQTPQWQDKSFVELIESAFKDRVITVEERIISKPKKKKFKFRQVTEEVV